MSVETQRPAGDIVRVEVSWTHQLHARVSAETLLRNPMMLIWTVSFPVSLVVALFWPEMLRGPWGASLAVSFAVPLLWGAIWLRIRRLPEQRLGYVFRDDGFEIRALHGQFNGKWPVVSQTHERPHAREFVVGSTLHVLPYAVMSDGDRAALDRLFALHVPRSAAPRHQLLKLLALWAVLLGAFYALYAVFVGGTPSAR